MNLASWCVPRRVLKIGIMKLKNLLGWSAALCLGACALQAQQTGSEAESIRRQLKEANEAFQKAVEQYRSATEALGKRLDAVEKKPGGPPAPLAQSPPPAPPPVDKKPWSPTDQIRVAGQQQNYLNLSFTKSVSSIGDSIRRRTADVKRLCPR